METLDVTKLSDFLYPIIDLFFEAKIRSILLS